MAPSTSTTASPLSRILLSLPKPSTAQPSRCAKAPSTDSGAATGAKKKNLVFSRREAAATALSTVLSRVLPAVAAETDVASATTGECALETTPSGLAFCDRVVGAGAEAVKGQLIKAHYRGMLEDGTVFDSSYGRGRPLTIMVGVGEVIKGWDLCIAGGEGIPPMRVGGKRSLKLPPELAYGEKGAGCRGWEPTSCVIPPNSTLLFDVEYVGRASS